MKKKTKKKPAKKVKKKSAPKKVKKAAKKKVKKVARAKGKSAKKVKVAVVTAPPTYVPAANEVSLGVVEDYFGHISVLALTIKESLNIGDTIHVHGHTTDITQKVDSMQINHVAVLNAKKGDSIGIKVNDKCRKGDKVFRVN